MNVKNKLKKVYLKSNKNVEYVTQQKFVKAFKVKQAKWQWHINECVNSLLYQLNNKKSQNDCAVKINILATKFFLLIEVIDFQNITNDKFVTYFLNIEETMITN